MHCSRYQCYHCFVVIVVIIVINVSRATSTITCEPMCFSTQLILLAVTFVVVLDTVIVAVLVVVVVFVATVFIQCSNLFSLLIIAWR